MDVLTCFLSLFYQAAIYYFMTIVTGMFLGVFWGVLFGGLNYVVVWVVQPVMKLLFVSLRLVAMPTRAVVRAFLDPFFQVSKTHNPSNQYRLNVSLI